MSTENSIYVRMYRQGLGDCFLLTLPSTGERPFYIMIDCGVIQGTKNASAEMRRALRDIIKVTEGSVDALVVTHEHWDHVSGFTQARELFRKPEDPEDEEKLSVEEVWLAWTEDRTDSLANRLREDREQGVRAMHGLTDALGQSGLKASPLYNGLNELMGFFGAAKGGTTGAMDFAKSLGRRGPRYWRPTEQPWEHEVVPGIRIYALGPPHDEAMIKRTYSRKEVYHEFANSALVGSFFAAAADRFGFAGLRDDLDEEDHAPFDYVWGHRLNRWYGNKKAVGRKTRLTPQEIEFFDRYYGAAEGSDPWRRIDEDWLGVAADFALRLDSATNNTSLVLAIEMVESGRVLLFAADAQVGNWQSWQDLSWTLPDGATVTGPDLLHRTVFYKVGHHGSHNATLKEKGLEQMNNDEFVAFLPVDIAAARKKNWNRMPQPKLVKAMKKKAKGRVVQLDSGAEPDPEVAQDFEDRLEKKGHYFEYRIGD